MNDSIPTKQEIDRLFEREALDLIYKNEPEWGYNAFIQLIKEINEDYDVQYILSPYDRTFFPKVWIRVDIHKQDLLNPAVVKLESKLGFKTTSRKKSFKSSVCEMTVAFTPWTR